MHSRPALLASLLLAAVAFAVAGCGSSDDASGAGGKRAVVVATTTQLGDFVRNVGGDAVDVHQILQPNSDPHEYELRPADAQAAAGASLVVESGNELDRWAADLVKESGGDADELTVAPAHTPERVPGEREGDEASRYDPHWWHDPRNAEAAVVAIRDALVKAEPSQAATFRANAARYVGQIKRLDAGIAACMRAVPEGERKLVTSHDAFNYFAKRYAIRVIGAVIPSQSTKGQPSAGQVATLVRLVERERVKAVFPESSVNPRLARAIARQSGADATGVLYGDTLGPQGSPAATYLGMETANADAMVKGFTGRAGTCDTGVD